MTLGSRRRLRPNTKVATRQLPELENSSSAHYHHRHHRARSSSAQQRGFVATIAVLGEEAATPRRYVCITYYTKRDENVSRHYYSSTKRVHRTKIKLFYVLPSDSSFNLDKCFIRIQGKSFFFKSESKIVFGLLRFTVNTYLYSLVQCYIRKSHNTMRCRRLVSLGQSDG